MKSRMKDTLLLIGSEMDRMYLHSVFEAQYYLLESDTAVQGAMLLQQNMDYIAAVVVDLPEFDAEGLRALLEVRNSGGENRIPVLCIVTASRSSQVEERAFLMGVSDVVRKPYMPLSLQRRVQILTDLNQNRLRLEQLVEDQSKAILNANQTVLDTLSALLEHRSTESGNHILRIRQLTKILLAELSRCYPEYNLSENDIDRISSASALHDIGKISIPDNILHKPGKLTTEEFAVMKTHTTIGAQMVENLEKLGDITFLRYAYNICLYHHERWDGNGYPFGLSEEQIPICAQVVGLADAFDALTSVRVYKDAIDYKEACNMILNGECGLFSPKVLECFKRVRNTMVEKAQQYTDGLSPQSEQIRMPLPDPLHQDIPLNALQLSQLKYQSLLHHIDDTVIELDVDHRIFHVVNNPNPDFVSLFLNTSFNDIFDRLLTDGVHPDDVPIMLEAQQNIAQKLFGEKQRKYSFRCRLYNPPDDQFYPYQITYIRVNTGNPAQRILLVVFHNLNPNAEPLPEKWKNLSNAPELYDLLGGVLCCRNDNAQTILEGANTLLALTGYSARALEERHGNSLWNLIYPPDRPILEDLIQQLQTESILHTQLRICQRNGDPLWVIVKSRLHTDRQGNEFIYYVLSEITELQDTIDQLRSDAQRHRRLTELSEGIVFEWDLKTRIFTCSERWAKRFGHNLNGTHLNSGLADSVFLHPDDIPALLDALRNLSKERQSTIVDIRIANSEGRYLWSRIRAGARWDNGGNLTHYIGLIYDIDDLKTAALDMRQQAQLDGLTNLLNKTSTQNAITDYLTGRNPDSLAALLMLDIDNFKHINDNYGHLYGDAVLAQVGSSLRSLFRPNDVLGRIGGDEFLILMEDIPHRNLVESRCQLLVDTFREQFQRQMPNSDVSVSVGVALIPQHGDQYEELFRFADEALYVAKRQGKCQYHIYTCEEQALGSAGENLAVTVIDSEQRMDAGGDSLLRFAFSKLYESRDLEAAVNELLAIVGHHFNVSRVYIFENNEDNTFCSNTFEWCNLGVEPQKDFLQNVSYTTDIPGWQNVYDEKGILYCTDIQELAPQYRAILEPQGIKSMLHCTIMDQGVFRGYVGFDECTANFRWTPGQVTTLEYIARILAVFLLKHRHNNS